jgi:hypothetical protein
MTTHRQAESEDQISLLPPRSNPVDTKLKSLHNVEKQAGRLYSIIPYYSDINYTT